MNRSVTFTIPGNPVPKGRPRHTKSGHTYTPKRTREYEDEVGNAWTGKGPRPPQFPAGVRVFIQVRERVYASDLDNYVKIVLDGLNGIAWADDKQVEVIHATIERKHPSPGITVEIRERPWDARAELLETAARVISFGHPT